MVGPRRLANRRVRTVASCRRRPTGASRKLFANGTRLPSSCPFTVAVLRRCFIENASYGANAQRLSESTSSIRAGRATCSAPRHRSLTATLAPTATPRQSSKQPNQSALSGGAIPTNCKQSAILHDRGTATLRSNLRAEAEGYKRYPDDGVEATEREQARHLSQQLAQVWPSRRNISCYSRQLKGTSITRREHIKRLARLHPRRGPLLHCYQAYFLLVPAQATRSTARRCCAGTLPASKAKEPRACRRAKKKAAIASIEPPGRSSWLAHPIDFSSLAGAATAGHDDYRRL